MIFITGPLYSGKQEYAEQLLQCGREEVKDRIVRDVQNLAVSAQNLEALADELSHYEAVIATEIGGGVVPTDPGEREAREKAGRLACLLAQRAECVVRVYCGIPVVLKGTLKP